MTLIVNHEDVIHQLTGNFDSGRCEVETRNCDWPLDATPAEDQGALEASEILSDATIAPADIPSGGNNRAARCYRDWR